MNRKAFYDSLSEEVKLRLRACDSEEAMMKVPDEEKIHLDPELPDKVSDGFEYGGPADYTGC